MSRKKKVLMLASVASMIDQFNMPNIRLMLDMGYEVHVACNFREGNTCDGRRVGELQRTLRRMRVVWHQWDCPRGIGSIRKCTRAYWQLWKLTGRHHYEWLHCHSPIGGVLARLAAHRRGIRVAYTAHGFHFYQGAPLRNWLLYYPLEKLLAHWTDALITVNREDYRFAKKHLKAKRIYHIPGIGLGLDKFAAGKPPCGDEKNQFRRKYRIPEDALLLLSVGELNKGKNHRMVIDALAALRRQDVYYMICGQGALRRKLKQHAGSLGVSSRIRMLGYQEEMPWIYQNADIFVFPSMREGMPVALMEAMAAGLPCVVSDIRGNRELICGAGEDDAGCGNEPVRHCINNAVIRHYGNNGVLAGKKTLQIRPGGIRFPLGQPGQLQKALEILLEDGKLGQECGKYNQKKIRSYGQAAVQKRMQKIYADFSDAVSVPGHKKL